MPDDLARRVARIAAPNVLAITLLAVTGFWLPSGVAASSWVRSWSASPASETGPPLSGDTVRQVLRLSIGGKRLRVRLSNEVATDNVTVLEAHAALPGATPGSIETWTDRPMTFGGLTSVTIAPGGLMLSDPIDLQTPDLAKVAVSLALASAPPKSVSHRLGQETAFVARGDQVASSTLSGGYTTEQRLYLSGIDVEVPTGGAVVVLGDSITDGRNSTVDADRRWTDRLAERLAADAKAGVKGVSNAGVGGNRLLDGAGYPVDGPSALARLDRDALAASAGASLIVFEGTNDILGPVRPDRTAAEVVAAYSQIISRAHARGFRVIGATLLPFGNCAGYTADKDAIRQAVNQWIRTSGTYDGLIDFDSVMKDPFNPTLLSSRFDSGDHLHPNDAGYRAMGDAVALTLFEAP